MAKRKTTQLQYTVIHVEAPDAAARIARAFDVILENAARRRLEAEGAVLKIDDGEHFHELGGGQHD